jgi:hypothetical protein
MAHLLYAAIYNDSDGYTYSCQVMLGVFSERSLADGCILEEVKSKKYSSRKLEDYEVIAFQLDVTWEDQQL